MREKNTSKGSSRNKFTFCCRPPDPLARRERRCAPGAVREERATKPAGLRAAARRGAIRTTPGCDKNTLQNGFRRSRPNVKLFRRDAGCRAVMQWKRAGSTRTERARSTETRRGQKAL
jgi:hypothetical protein